VPCTTAPICRDLIDSLRDNLEPARIEIDMLRFSGPCFKDVDNRLMSLHLVQCELTNAVMFGAGDVLQPSEVLHKKAILVERGSFRPPTLVNIDMIECAKAMFLKEEQLQGKEVEVLMELTMNNLLSDGALDAEDFLSRVDLLGDIGYTVLISNYQEYYRLTSYFRRYTKEMIGVAMGVNNVQEVFDEKYYSNLEGGILEAFGRMFRNSVKLYVYPMWLSEYELPRAQRRAGRQAKSRSGGGPRAGGRGQYHSDGNVADLYEHICKTGLVTSVAGLQSGGAAHLFPRRAQENQKSRPHLGEPRSCGGGRRHQTARAVWLRQTSGLRGGCAARARARAASSLDGAISCAVSSAGLTTEGSSRNFT
jgi:hypothetical protein